MLWLSIDQGGHATRAIAFDEAGRIVARSESAVATYRNGERVEHDAGELASSVQCSIDGVTRELGPRRRHVVSAGLATQRSTLLCVRRSSGTSLTPVLSWQDRRGRADLEHLTIDGARVQAITGLRLSPHYGASKILWLLRHDPSVRAAAASEDLVAAPLASFVVHTLATANRWHVDPANASRMLLMDADRLAWSSELMEAFGISRSLLPDILPSRAAYGELLLGETAVPLEVVTGDQSAALFCAGEPAPGTAFINVGTGAFIQVAVGPARVCHTRLLGSIAWAGDDRLYVLEGTVNGAGSALMEQAAALGMPEVDYTALARALARSDRRGVFLNGVAGLGSPDWIPDFGSRHLDSVDADEKLAAVVDSIVFLIVRNLEVMREVVPVERIVLTGGLARLTWIGQQLACLSELPVHHLDEREATARGLAFLTSRRVMDAAPRGRLFEPRSVGAMGRRYERWRAAMRDALASVGER